MTGIIFKEKFRNYSVIILYRSKSPARLLAENFAFFILLVSGWIEKSRAVLKSEFSRMVFSKRAPLSSQLPKIEFRK